MSQEQWLTKAGRYQMRNDLVNAAISITTKDMNPDNVTFDYLQKLRLVAQSKVVKMDDNELSNRLSMAQNDLHKAFAETINK